MTSEAEYHVTSFVCQVIPEQMKKIKAEILKVASAQIHANNEVGKVVFTLEGPSQAFISDGIEKLRVIDGVLTLAPIYHQYIDE